MINISIFDSVESNALCLSKTTEKTLVPEAQWSFKIFVYYANMLSRKNPSDTFKHQLFDKEVTKSSRKTKVSITLKKFIQIRIWDSQATIRKQVFPLPYSWQHLK